MSRCVKMLALMLLLGSGTAKAELDMSTILTPTGFSVQLTGFEDLSAYQVELILTGSGLTELDISAALPASNAIFFDNDPGFPTFAAELFDASEDPTLGVGEIRLVLSDFYTGANISGSVSDLGPGTPKLLADVTIEPGISLDSVRFLGEGLLLVDPTSAPIEGFEELQQIQMVPEPSSCFLVLSGIIPAALALRRRAAR